MKTILIHILLLIPYFLWTQTVETTAVEKEVDSLIAISDSLIALGDMYKATEMVATAEKLALEKLGEESIAYTISCNKFGKLSNYKGDIAAVEYYWQKEKDIRKKVQETENPEYAGTLINLSIVYMNTIQLDKAEAVLVEAKEIFEVALEDQEHPFYLNCLSNLARLRSKLGEYDESETLYLELLAVKEKTVGKDDPGYGIGLNNLAYLYQMMQLNNYMWK